MNASSRATMDTVGIGRRRFLQLGVLGGGASLLAFPAVAGAKNHVPVLLLSCMDYRLIQATERYMDGRKLRRKYDHVILAGASLGAITEKFPAWNKTFWEHLDVAIELHGVSKVIVLDHRKCGAYDEILGPECCKDPAEETAVHTKKLQELRKQIKDHQFKGKPAGLGVELLLMSLNGKVEKIK